MASGPTLEALGTMPCRPWPGSVAGSVLGSRFVVSISIGCSTAWYGENTCAPYPCPSAWKVWKGGGFVRGVEVRAEVVRADVARAEVRAEGERNRGEGKMRGSVCGGRRMGV